MAASFPPAKARPQNIAPSENKITATGPDRRRGGSKKEGVEEEINNMLVSINLASIWAVSFTFHGNGSSDLLKCLSSA